MDLLLLLALYREITLTNASLVQSPKLEEVRKLSILLKVRLEYVNVVHLACKWFQYFVLCDRPGEGYSERSCCW